MNNKVDKHIHEQLNALYDDCKDVVGSYDYFKSQFYNTDPKEFVLSYIDEQVTYIKQMIEVFQNAELITNKERRLVDYCAYRMQREAKRMLREHINKESA